MSSFPSEAKEPVGVAADGTPIKIGDKVPVIGEVIQISDAIAEITTVLVRVPDRLGGAGLMCVRDKDIPTVTVDSS